MKKLSLFLVMAFPLFALAQSADSLRYYQSQLYQMRRNAQDSLMRSEAYIAVVDRIKELRHRSNDYSGAVLFMDVMHTSYSKFNTSIAQEGFSPMDPISFRLGFGTSHRSGRSIIDIYFMTVGFNNISKKGDEKIESSLSNFFQFDLGYDLIGSRKVSIYPFAGLSLRISTLEYSKPAQVNSSYTNITNIVINDQSVSASSTKLGYSAGLGIDVLVADKKESPGLFLFTKFGLNRPVGKDKYKIHDEKYVPGYKQGDWLFSLGIKVANWY